MMGDAVGRGDRLGMAASALAECLVGPARRGEDAVQRVLELVERLPIAVVAIDEEIALTAARLRASHRTLRLPDALVIASAVCRQADELVTTDRRWPTSRQLKVNTVVTLL